MSTAKKMVRLKIAIIGPPKSGKTSFVANFINKKKGLEKQDEGTYRVNLHQLTTDNKQYEIQFWNCGNQHMNNNKYIRNAFFKNCSAAFLMFDLSKPENQWESEVKEWLEEAYQFDCFLVYAIGTKGDYKIKNHNQTVEPISSSIERSLTNDIDIMEDTKINHFFEEYQIQHFFQNATEKISRQIHSIFLKIQNDQYKRARGSMAIPRRFDNSVVDKESVINISQPGLKQTIVSIKEEELSDNESI